MRALDHSWHRNPDVKEASEFGPWRTAGITCYGDDESDESLVALELSCPGSHCLFVRMYC
jgi:hypothetical protein